MYQARSLLTVLQLMANTAIINRACRYQGSKNPAARGWFYSGFSGQMISGAVAVSTAASASR